MWITRFLFGFLIALTVIGILTLGCATKGPKHLDYQIGEKQRYEIRYCVRAELDGGAIVEFCADRDTVCFIIAEWARTWGRHWSIRNKRVRIKAVGRCVDDLL